MIYACAHMTHWSDLVSDAQIDKNLPYFVMRNLATLVIHPHDNMSRKSRPYCDGALRKHGAPKVLQYFKKSQLPQMNLHNALSYQSCCTQRLTLSVTKW